MKLAKKSKPGVFSSVIVDDVAAAPLVQLPGSILQCTANHSVLAWQTERTSCQRDIFAFPVLPEQWQRGEFLQCRSYLTQALSVLLNFG